MSHQEHREHMPDQVRISILTLSDTRTETDDISGKLLIDLFSKAGHSIDHYRVIKEDPDLIRATLEELLARQPDAIVTTGGTGLTARDGTIEVAKTLFSKELPGFGELFRHLSFQQIGSAAILSRATAGVAQDSLLVCVPGSVKAVRLAVTRILLPEIGHMVWEIRRHAKNRPEGRLRLL